MQVYLQETCNDMHERSGTNKLIWECCISYSTLIGVVCLQTVHSFQSAVVFVILCEMIVSKSTIIIKY